MGRETGIFCCDRRCVTWELCNSSSEVLSCNLNMGESFLNRTRAGGS